MEMPEDGDWGTGTGLEEIFAAARPQPQSFRICSSILYHRKFPKMYVLYQEDWSSSGIPDAIAPSSSPRDYRSAAQLGHTLHSRSDLFLALPL
ncbi:hypothetical protein E1B28_005663 [Marasmius oreades]|uniref:Uncharacterized protein n=1 Tax=Marasmius oreades TaxID=181124 RepID=A0A9P7S499_9AGAR|nr:uncharacterized protein E1B28_005663 [Marasmius oreades]KAG7094855.1 hypothetical protein E1B28_005663 [Marasmius oreades]